MNTQANGSPVKYTVEIPGSIKTAIMAQGGLAASRGQLGAYVNAWQQIEKRLQSEPMQFGECHYHLASGVLRCQIGIIPPVAVEFAIHETRKTVVLLKVSLLE